MGATSTRRRPSGGTSPARRAARTPRARPSATRALGRVDEEPWDRLRREFLAKQPVCPDCGAEWDLDSANEEEGVTFGGQEVISISAACSKYDEDDFAGRKSAPHPISDGMGEHELQLT